VNHFSATTESEAVVPAERDRIWTALTDPVLLPRLTPLLRRIETDGDRWRWSLIRIAALGVGISPTFTERMRFTPSQRIDYSHEPPAGVTERTGAEGYYILNDAPGGTQLSIRLTLQVELPLPRSAGPAVRAVMKTTMASTGDRFSANLLDYLGYRGDGHRL
jgi:hypothetical protein